MNPKMFNNGFLPTQSNFECYGNDCDFSFNKPQNLYPNNYLPPLLETNKNSEFSMNFQNNNMNSFNSINNGGGYGSGINGMEFGTENNGLIDKTGYGVFNNGYFNNFMSNQNMKNGINNMANGEDNGPTNEDINYVTNALKSVNINGYGNNNNYENYGRNTDLNNYRNNNFNGNVNNFAGNLNGQENFISNNFLPNNNEYNMESGMIANLNSYGNTNSYGNYNNMFGNGMINPQETSGSIMNMGNRIEGNFGGKFGENNVEEFGNFRGENKIDFDPRKIQRYNQYLELINQKYGIVVPGRHSTYVKNLPTPIINNINNEDNMSNEKISSTNNVIDGSDNLPSKTGSLVYGSYIQSEKNKPLLNGDGDGLPYDEAKWQPFDVSNNQNLESNIKMPNYQSTSSIQALTQQVCYF